MTSDHTRARKAAIREFSKRARVSDCGFHFAIVPRDGDVFTLGLASTADLAMAFEALCDDLERSHRYGRCEHCDRLAMAMRGARAKFREIFGAQPTECRQ